MGPSIQRSVLSISGRWGNGDMRLVPKSCRLGGMLIEKRQDTRAFSSHPHKLALVSKLCKLLEHKAKELRFFAAFLIRGSLQAQGCSQVMTLLEWRNFPFSRGLAFPRIVLNSIGESLLCPGNSSSLCNPPQKVTNPERMLQCSDVAQAEGTARWWLGGRSRGCATGRAGKWMQVASESPAIAGGGPVVVLLMFQAERGHWKRKGHVTSEG